MRKRKEFVGYLTGQGLSQTARAPAPVRVAPLTECADYDSEHRSTVVSQDNWSRSHATRVGMWTELNAARKWEAQQEMAPLLSKRERGRLQGMNPRAREEGKNSTDETLARIRNNFQKAVEAAGRENRELDRYLVQAAREEQRNKSVVVSRYLVWRSVSDAEAD